MLCFDCLVRWALSDYRKGLKWRRQRRDVENGASGQDVTDGRIRKSIEPPPQRPLIYALISFWAYFENLALVLVLIMHTADNYDNFLHGFCNTSSCSGSNIVMRVLVFKIIASLLFFIGSHTVCTKNEIFACEFIEKFPFEKFIHRKWQFSWFRGLYSIYLAYFQLGS